MEFHNSPVTGSVLVHADIVSSNICTACEASLGSGFLNFVRHGFKALKNSAGLTGAGLSSSSLASGGAAISA